MNMNGFLICFPLVVVFGVSCSSLPDTCETKQPMYRLDKENKTLKEGDEWECHRNGAWAKVGSYKDGSPNGRWTT